MVTERAAARGGEPLHHIIIATDSQHTGEVSMES